MTGTGTQTDPYIVDNLSDLLVAISADGAYVELNPDTAVKVIDFNDNPQWCTETPLFFACTHLNGNGWSVHNIMAKNCDFLVLDVKTYTTIENLNIESAYLLNSSQYGGIYLLSAPNSNTGESNLTLKNCKISAVLDAVTYPVSLIYDYRASVNLYNCSLNITMKGNAVIRSPDTVENCNFTINGRSSNSTPLNFNITEMSKIKGTLKSESDSDVTINIGSTSAYNVIDLEFTGNNTALTVKNYGKTLVNTDKITGFSSITLTDATCGVTSSQMIDSEHLNSIGFMIGGE